jgi:hypothetical protein
MLDRVGDGVIGSRLMASAEQGQTEAMGDYRPTCSR